MGCEKPRCALRYGHGIDIATATALHRKSYEAATYTRVRCCLCRAGNNLDLLFGPRRLVLTSGAILSVSKGDFSPGLLVTAYIAMIFVIAIALSPANSALLRKSETRSALCTFIMRKFFCERCHCLIPLALRITQTGRPALHMLRADVGQCFNKCR